MANAKGDVHLPKRRKTRPDVSEVRLSGIPNTSHQAEETAERVRHKPSYVLTHADFFC